MSNGIIPLIPPPIPPTPAMNGARTLVRNGLAQTDLDMDFHKLLNLDISNLPFPPADGILPPSITPTPHFWIDGWDRTTQAWHVSQPGFDDLLPPTQDVSLGRQRIVQLADPETTEDAVNLGFLEAYVNGIANLSVHAPVAAATNVAMGVIQGLNPVDGYTPVAGDRILVKAEHEVPNRASTNGIYIASAGQWTRAPDMADMINHPEDFEGAYCLVLNGNTHANTGWVQIGKRPFGTPPYNPITFVLAFVGGGIADLVAGNGIDISGNVISALGTTNRITVSPTGINIATNYAGQTSITQLGTIAVGTWQGAPIAGDWGGTGVQNVGRKITLGGDLTLSGGFPLTFTLPSAVNASLKGSGNYWPLPALVDGRFLSNAAGVLVWDDPVTPTTYINVKDPPYNAVGDGVADDTDAINAAITAANGATVYFPSGTYYLQKANLAPTVKCVLVGDNASNSVLKGNATKPGAVISLMGGSTLTGIGVDGNLTGATSGVAVQKHGMSIVGQSLVTLVRCAVINCSGNGINIVGSTSVRVLDCMLDNFGLNALLSENSPRTRVTGGRYSRAVLAGIALINSPQSFVAQNSVTSCGLSTFGVVASDSDNTVIGYNTIQQCCFGLSVFSSPTRVAQSFGVVANGNNLIRNYEGGARITLSHGFQFTGNLVNANGQGGQDNNTLTVEPGVAVASGGTGYQAGDILTLVGGTGSPAKVLVTAVVGVSGAISAIMPITLGAYTGFPSNPVSVTGGAGSGATITLTGAIVQNGGSGYVLGQTLRATNGAFSNPARIQVTSLGAGGAVKSFEVLDGGGYSGALPLTSLVFTPENLSDNQGTGTGLTVTPSFGKRYSAAFNGTTSFGIATLGQIQGGVVGNNVISATRGGVGVLVTEDTGSFIGRASYMTVTGNNMMNNAFVFKGQTVGNPLDDNYNFNSIFDNNVVFP